MTECWESPLTPSQKYPKIKRSGQMVYVDRLLWEHINGPVPPGMLLCHHCDNTRCIRPSHMFVGTDKDNARDRDRKGRNRWKMIVADDGCCAYGHPRREGEICLPCQARRQRDYYYRRKYSVT